MKTEDLMDAFHYLDDDIIETVDFIRKNPVKKTRRWRKCLAAAACICILITAFRFLPARLRDIWYRPRQLFPDP